MRSPFASVWADDFAAFLTFKRTLGYAYTRAELTLRALDRFLVAQRRPRGYRELDDAVLSWLGRRPGRKSISVANELCVIRKFYGFLRRRGRRVAPEPSWPRIPRSSDYVPYVLSTAQVTRLLHQAARLRKPSGRLTYRALILILYCTGLRLGEAVRLRLRDVDLPSAALFVVASKGRSRWVPCHHSLCAELGRYLIARKAFGTAGPDDRLFVTANQGMLPVPTASDCLRRLLRSAGFKPASGRVGPRPYDLRRTFAVHRLTRWYRTGVDLHSRLPWLSAYMGHDDLLGTEVYLNATPELLALAGSRFRRRFISEEGQQA